MLYKGTGYIQSPPDDRDAILNIPTHPIPDEYKLKDLGAVFDQGQDPICAAVCLAEILDWRGKVKNQSHKRLNPYDIYDLREDHDMDGMVLRDAIKTVKEKGVGGHIQSYARINDPVTAKVAIQLNGPIVIGTYAYNNNRFWKPTGDSKPEGGHATILVGWDKDGFVLQNSWGVGWGSGGRMTFPDDDWSYVLECWTIII